MVDHADGEVVVVGFAGVVDVGDDGLGVRFVEFEGAVEVAFCPFDVGLVDEFLGVVDEGGQKRLHEGRMIGFELVDFFEFVNGARFLPHCEEGESESEVSFGILVDEGNGFFEGLLGFVGFLPGVEGESEISPGGNVFGFRGGGGAKDACGLQGFSGDKEVFALFEYAV